MLLKEENFRELTEIMKTINIEDFATRIDKTLVYALNCAQSVKYKMPNEKLGEFIKHYMPVYSDKIFECLEQNLDMLNDINFTDIAKEKCLKKKFLEKTNTIILMESG